MIDTGPWRAISCHQKMLPVFLMTLMMAKKGQSHRRGGRAARLLPHVREQSLLLPQARGSRHSAG